MISIFYSKTTNIIILVRKFLLIFHSLGKTRCSEKELTFNPALSVIFYAIILESYYYVNIYFSSWTHSLFSTN